MPTRRSTLAGLAATLAALTAAPALPETPRRVRPPRLREGDTLGLVAPAGFVTDRFGVEAIEDTVRAMGLVPRTAAHVAGRSGYLAGDDATRARELTEMFEDDGVRAVMAVRGGWGCARVLPYLDFARIARHPKLYVGFSDNTAMHLAFAARTGVVSIHGPNASASWPEGVWQQFHALAFEGATPTYTISQETTGGLGRREGQVRTFHGGKARGRLLGGNLTVLSALVGTPYLPDFSGAILFLEDTNEAEYRIDRMITQLALAGILGQVAGVVFGQCTNCVEHAAGYGNFTVYEVMEQHFAKLGVPAFQGARIGHIGDQVSIPVGVEAEIDADAGTIRMLEPAVS
ncbi:LD-carboxypeptidase [Novosphingobium sp. PC22D]|uniref:S66 peptidase family protein n=1 Tax=Novosphingobium sp. PC22D TaxID=1962403 RepID=UPI000BEF4288|nr:LD-carboxypeptidase [Novosphingobium sp. PC22D]PEQ11588.1 LD-carboxypeptidase [Novosphingobium sp. PC22D]